MSDVYRYRLNLYDVTHYLDQCLETASASAMALAVTEAAPMIDAHLRLLLLNENWPTNDIRKVLLEHLPSEIADPIAETVHDMLLMEVRPYLTLDDDQEVIEVRVFANTDAEVVVRDCPWVNAVLPE